MRSTGNTQNKTALLKALLAMLCGLIFIFPLLWMLSASFQPDRDVMSPVTSLWQFIPQSLNFDNYVDVFRRMHFANSVFISLAFSLIIVSVGLIINSAAGFAFARLNFKGSSWIFAIVAALIIIPFETLALPLFLLIGVKWGLINTLPGLFLPYLAKAFNIFFMRQYFLSLPRDLEEAARVEGASWFRIFFTVALPLAKPALATCAVLDFITHWSEYLWPLIITNKTELETLQVGLGHFYTLPPIQWGDIMAYSVMATLPMLAVFVFFQKYLVLNLASSGIKE